MEIKLVMNHINGDQSILKLDQDNHIVEIANILKGKYKMSVDEKERVLKQIRSYVKKLGW